MHMPMIMTILNLRQKIVKYYGTVWFTFLKRVLFFPKYGCVWFPSLLEKEFSAPTQFTLQLYSNFFMSFLGTIHGFLTLCHDLFSSRLLRMVSLLGLVEIGRLKCREKLRILARLHDFLSSVP